MFPNAEQLGVVIDKGEAELAMFMHEIAQRWLPELKRSSAGIKLPEPNVNGDINLDLDSVDKVASVGMIALSQLQKEIRVDESEYDGCISRQNEDDDLLACDIDAKIKKELLDGKLIKSFISNLQTTGEQSRAQFTRASTSQ